MSIRTVIETIAGQMSSAPTFKYGTINELDTIGDNVSKWPVVFMYQITQVDLSFAGGNGVNDNTNLNILFLDKCEFGEFANETESIREAQLGLAKQFMLRMQLYRENGDKVFKITNGNKAKGVYIYDEFDVNVTGIRLEMPAPTMYKDSTCSAL